MKLLLVLFFVSCSFQSFAENESVYAGKVVKLSKIISLPVKKLESLSKKYEGPNVVTSITLYKLKYFTTDLNGKLVIASASVVVPDQKALDQRPVVSYQHGTATKDTDVPSNPYSLEGPAAGALFASQGYLVIAADYLGLGVNRGFHPYLHAESQASTCVDALKALYSLNLTTSNQLYLTGYSQGGHVTMALHQRLELLEKSLPQVTASAPMSGPYDLSNTMIQKALHGTEPSKYTSLYSAYVIYSMNQIYKLKPSLKDIFKDDYASEIPEMFNGNYDYDQITPLLPLKPVGMLKKSYLQELLQKDNSLVKALKKNDVYQWKPEAPVQLCGGKGDKDVSFENSVVAYNWMKAEGSTISLINVGDDKDHMTSYEPCIKASFVFFETIRAQKSASN